MLSESRLREFMQAEISYFAQMSPRPVKLTQILSASTPEQVVDLVHTELPRHFATRIKHVEMLPSWDSSAELIGVHKVLSESFQNLRLVEQGPDPQKLTDVIHDLRRRHKAVVPLLGTAIAQLRAEAAIDEAFANEWLETFLIARISTEMLTAHYMAIHASEDDSVSSRVGIVDSRCDPGEICRLAAAKVREAESHLVPIHVESHACTSSQERIEFSFLPQYLSLIVEELIKNSVLATVRSRSEGNLGEYPIRVVVAADERQVRIRISDKGGGIRASVGGNIWSYSLEPRGDASAGSQMFEDPSWQDPTSWADPLRGLGLQRRLGMGLPLSRLYTKYLGGSLEIMTIPGHGVDAFVSLQRIDLESIRNASVDD